jgi:predicted nucleotidyltransferase
MRLTSSQVRLVKEAVARHFGPTARVWLFGSRTDDSRRGGDFDFYVETDLSDPDEVIDGKLGVLSQLHTASDFEGEKIDLIIESAVPGPHPPIYEAARRHGVRL